jgi:broad specificity phosphatase PhoE
MHIILVRHGQSEALAGLSNEVDCGLTADGAAQAGALAAALAPEGLTWILSSPLRRCLLTAEVIRRVTGAPAELCPALHEHHHDPFPAGWPLPGRASIAASFPHFIVPPDMPETHWASAPEDRPRLWQRMSGVVTEILDRFERQADARVAVVTHGAPASVFVQAFCQWTNPLRASVRIDPGSLSILTVESSGRRVLAQLNCMPPPIT